MEQEGIFSTLAPEIILNILSRVPVKSVFTCKCVCKSWLSLLKTTEFARSHLCNSVPRLLIHRFHNANDEVFKVVELEDSHGIERQEPQYKTALELKCQITFRRSVTVIEGSTDGLLFFHSQHSFPTPDDYYICNPITHEFMELPKPEGVRDDDSGMVDTYGFGVSRTSNQYKVVRVFHSFVRDPNTGSVLSISMYVVQVYTLGMRSWRCIATPREMSLNCGYSTTGKLLNGSLHFLARDFEGSLCISCFDLEMETFTKFPAPVVESGGSMTELGVLRDRLCLSEYSSHSEIVVYLKCDGEDGMKSWNKEYVISKAPFFFW